MGLTEDLRKYVRTLNLDFIGFSPADRFDGAPEDRRPDIYLKDARSVISIE